MSLSLNIKKLRESRNLSQAELGKIVGASDKAVSTWENGKREPRMGAIQKLANYFDIKMSDLIDNDNIITTNFPSNALPLPKMKQIPLYDGIACGEPIRAEQNTIDMINCPTTINADFSLVCHGDSMINARIFNGDVVLIHSQPTVENGEIAAVEIEDEHDSEYSATLKRFYSDGKSIRLHAENPTIPDRYFTGEDMNKVHIAGKAVYFLSAVR